MIKFTGRGLISPLHTEQIKFTCRGKSKYLLLFLSSKHTFEIAYEIEINTLLHLVYKFEKGVKGVNKGLG